jgi:hypothetical protein
VPRSGEPGPIPAWRPERLGEDEWLAAQAEREQQRAAALTRAETVSRLTLLNVRHAMTAWDVRRDQPIAPWALAVLFAEPTPGRVPDIKAAARLVNEDPDIPSAAHLVQRLRTLIADRYVPPRQPFDVSSIASYIDSVQTPAPYLGVALSVLGNPAQPWEELRRGDSNDIPGHCYTVLADGSFLLVDRAPRRDLSRVTVYATVPVPDQPYLTGSSFRRWRHYPTVEAIGADEETWHQLHILHCLIGDPQHQPVLTPQEQR